ncbi:MAG: hypothetical protein MHM6MM_008251, partial [Cercozoa sp. M6MM]
MSEADDLSALSREDLEEVACNLRDENAELTLRAEQLQRRLLQEISLNDQSLPDEEELRESYDEDSDEKQDTVPEQKDYKTLYEALLRALDDAGIAVVVDGKSTSEIRGRRLRQRRRHSSISPSELSNSRSNSALDHSMHHASLSLADSSAHSQVPGDSEEEQALLQQMAALRMSVELRRQQEHLPDLSAWLEKRSPTSRLWQRRFVRVHKFSVYYARDELRVDIMERLEKESNSKRVNRISFFVIKDVAASNDKRSLGFSVAAKEPRTGKLRT